MSISILFKLRINFRNFKTKRIKVDLSQQDKDLIIGSIERGEPLPARFRQTLFDDPQTVELIWPGKTNYVERTVLPFQSIEQIDEPRTESNKALTLDLFSMDENSGRQKGGWSNKLIWGDNKLILSSLTNGPLKQEIEDATILKLVYIDSFFDVGADSLFDVEAGEDCVSESPSAIDEVVYRDTWGIVIDSFALVIYQRLKLICSLLFDIGRFYVHYIWRVNWSICCALVEIFKSDGFVNQISVCYLGPTSQKHNSSRQDDEILFCVKSENYSFNFGSFRVLYKKSILAKGQIFLTGREDDEYLGSLEFLLREELRLSSLEIHLVNSNENYAEFEGTVMENTNGTLLMAGQLCKAETKPTKPLDLRILSIKTSHSRTSSELGGLSAA